MLVCHALKIMAVEFWSSAWAEGMAAAFWTWMTRARGQAMTDETKHDPDGAPTPGPAAARAAARKEHERRCADAEPYTGGATVEALAERVESLRGPHSRSGPSGRNYARAVSSDPVPHPAGDRFDEADSDDAGELSWVAVLPECDRRQFAEDMSRLMAEAADTDDFALVEQALREWRVTAEVFADPELAERLTKPLVANGDRVPIPIA